MQREDHTPELESGAIKAVQDLYDVMHYDVLNINMRFATQLDFFSLTFGPFSVCYSCSMISLFSFSETTMRRGIFCQEQGIRVASFKN